MTLPALSRIQRFYAQQVHAVDAGDFTAYRDTFTETATFLLPGETEPVSGSQAISEHSEKHAARRNSQNIVQRHHVTMTGLHESAGGYLTARSCTVIVATPLGGSAVITAALECEDEFEERDGVLRIRRRRVTRNSP
ncbi:nuclear transport factor 2 family protein [Streptomyces sp. NPDC050636]|uniref:nuclear transport factor 2 family protein n=1 Tax=Streptomyces sp. NPDC050636 TaxID=3154510 RepID=UPI003448BADD